MWLHLWRNIRSAQVWWPRALRYKVAKSDYHGWHFCCGPFLDLPLSLAPDGKDLVSREQLKQLNRPPSPPPPSSPSSGFPTLSKARSSKRTLVVEVGAASLVAACHRLNWVIWSIFRRHIKGVPSHHYSKSPVYTWEEERGGQGTWRCVSPHPEIWSIDTFWWWVIASLLKMTFRSSPRVLF